MKPAKKPKKIPLATAVVFHGDALGEIVRRITAAGAGARMEITIDGAEIPQNAPAYITIVPGDPDRVTMFDDIAPINDSQTRPPFG